MNRLALRAICNLMAAARAVRHDDGAMPQAVLRWGALARRNNVLG